MHLSTSATRLPRALSPRALHLAAQTRSFSAAQIRRSAWTPGPAPPRLPKEEQEIFERLQRQSMGAFSQPDKAAKPHAEAILGDAESATRKPMQVNQSPHSIPEEQTVRVQTDGEGAELHPNIRRGAAPEFHGEKNPKTGEVGGPKNEPLRWGDGGDWSYNGRVTDF